MARAVDKVLNNMRKNGYSAPAHRIHTDEDSERQRAEKEAQKQVLAAQESYKQYQKQQQQAAIQNAVSPDMTSDSMAEYAKYKNTKGAQLASYDKLSDEVKGKLSELAELEDTHNTGLFRKTDDGSGLFGYKLDPNWKADDIANDLENNYGISSDSLDELKEVNRRAKNRDTVNSFEGDGYYENALQKDAEENYVRTQPEELEYARSRFSEVAQNTAELRADINRYNTEKAYSDIVKSESSQFAGSFYDITSGKDNVGKIKQELMQKYNLSDDEFEDLAYYGGELDDYDERVKQQETAQANVNTGSTSGNIAGGVKNSAIALAANPLAGIVSTTYTVGDKLGLNAAKRDKHSPLNTNSKAFALTNAVSDYQGATQQKISDWNKIAGMVYGAGMSAAESLETGILAPGGAAAGASVAAKLGMGAKATMATVKAGQAAASLIPFGANAFSSKLSENVSAGQEMNEAMTDALISAGIEVGTELLPFDHFWDIAKSNSRTARKVLVDFIIQSGLEGAEEYAGDWADRIIDDIRHGDESDFNQSVKAYMETPREDGTFMTEEEAREQAESDFMWQTLEDFATGAMSGAMGGAGATALSVVNSTKNAKTMFDGYSQQDYADLAKSLAAEENRTQTDEDGITYSETGKSLKSTENDISDGNDDNTWDSVDEPKGGRKYLSEQSKKTAEKAVALAEQYSQQDTVTDKQKRELYSLLSDMQETESAAAEKQYMQDIDDADKATRKRADWISHEAKVESYNESQKPDEEREARKQERADKEISDEQDRQIAESIPEDLRVKSNDSTALEIYNRMNNAATAAEVASAYEDGINSNDYNTRVQTEKNLDALTAKLNSKNISLEEIEAIKRSDTDIVKAAYNGDEISVVTNRQKQLYNYGRQQAIKARTEVNNEQKKAVEEKISTIKSETMQELYKDGYQTGMDSNAYTNVMDTMQSAGRNGTSEEQALEMVQAGLETIGGDTEALKAKAHEVYEYAQEQSRNETANAITKAIGLQQAVRKFGNGVVLDQRGNKSADVSGVNALKVISKYTGLDIVIYDGSSTHTNGVTKSMKGDNGGFRVQNSTIYLNADHVGEFAGTLFHEVGEFTSVYSPEQFAKLSKAMNSVMLKSMGSRAYNEMREQYWKSYAGQKGKSEIDLDKEITCDMLYQFLGTEDGLKKLLDEIDAQNAPKDAKSIKEKLADWIGKLADSLKEFFTGFQGNKYQKQVAEKQIAQMENLRDMLNQSVADAVKNYRQAQMDSLAKSMGVETHTDEVIPAEPTPQSAMAAAFNVFENAYNKAYAESHPDNSEKATGKISDETMRSLVAAGKEVNKAINALEAVEEIEKKAAEQAKIDEQSEEPSFDWDNDWNKTLQSSQSFTARMFLRELVDDLGFDKKGREDFDIRTTSYTPMYEEVGMLDLPYNDSNRLLQGDMMGKKVIYNKSARKQIWKGLMTKPIDTELHLSKLASTINHYEQKYGVTDDTVKGYLTTAKQAVNEIGRAIAEGRGGEEYASDITYEACNTYHNAIKELRKYAKKNVDGFDPADINTDSMLRSENSINKWQGAREFVQNTRTAGNGLESYLASKKITEPEREIELGGNKYSVSDDGLYAIDDDGRQIPIISDESGDNNGTVSEPEIKKAVKAALLQLRGTSTTIRSSGQVVGYDTKFAKEYAYTRHNRRMTDDGQLVKANATVNVKELVENAVNCRWVKNEDDQHSHDAARGWNYYDVDILVKNGSDLLHYRGLLNVRLDENGNDMVYDISDIDWTGTRFIGSANANTVSDKSPVQNCNIPLTDSVGKKLSRVQREFFNDSKAIDKDGRLKVMYHGTQADEFTVFDSGYSDYGKGFFFTDNKDYIARSYSDSDTEYAPSLDNSERKGIGTNYVVYLNLKNPYVVEADGKYYNTLTMHDEQFKQDMADLAEMWEEATDGNSDISDIANEIRSNNFSNSIDSLAKWLRRTSGVNVAKSDIEKMHEITKRWDRYADHFGRSEGWYYRETSDIVDLFNNGDIAMNTRDYVEYARENGHDGVIFKNLIDEGPYSDIWDMPSTVMVAFDSNQIKSVNNQNPSEDVDIRRSVNIEDSRNMHNDDITAEQQEEAAILEKGVEALKDTEINEKAVENIARDMKHKYNSAYDLEQFTDNLTKVFAYLHSNKNVNYNDFIAVVQDIARPVVDAAYTTTASREDYAAFRNAIDGMTFSLTNEQKQAIVETFGSMKTFERYYPDIHITEDGKSFAQQWSDIVDKSGGLVTTEIEDEDMPAELAGAFEALRPSMNMFEDNTRAAQNMALDIIERYLRNYNEDSATGAVVTADRRKAARESAVKTADRLREAHKKWKAQAEAKYKERLNEERELINEQVEQQISKEKQRSKENIARLRAKNATKIKGVHDKYKRNEQIRQISKSVGKLHEYLTSPTDKNHIPTILEEPVVELMAALDMAQPEIKKGKDGKWHVKIYEGRHTDPQTGKYKYSWKKIKTDTKEEAAQQYHDALAEGLGGANARKWYERMQEIADLYDDSENGKESDNDNQDLVDFIQGLNRELGEEFSEVLKKGRKSGVAIRDLNSSDLKVINNVLKNVLHAVNMVNKSFTVPSAEVRQMAYDVIDKSNKVVGRKNHKWDWVNKFDDFMGLSNMNPRTYMHVIGADKMIDVMLYGQNTKAARLKQAQEYGTALFKGVEDNEHIEWNTERTYLNGKLKATPFQIMNIYNAAQRPDAAQHFSGGFLMRDEKGHTNGDAVHLSNSEIQQLISTLTSKQKRIADGMQQFLANECADWNNEASELLYGYSHFNDPHYWTITTDKTTVRSNPGELTGSITNSVKNMGMTKAIKQGANNPLIIDSAFDVYLKHINDSAVYSAWAAPLQDMLRFFNYKEVITKDDGSVDYITTKNAIRKLLGDKGIQFFTKLYADIQHREQSSYEDPGFVSVMTGNAKKAATMANMRVALQQPTAIMRAGKRIDYKYLMQGVQSGVNNDSELKRLQNQMIGSDMVYWIKQQGNIDGQIITSFKEQITGFKGTGLKKWNNKLTNLSGELPAFMDQITWDAMYRACIAEQIDLMGRDKIGTQEFKDAVNYKFDHLMLETQVYDGTITRSQFMRSNDTTMKMLSSFMAEPVKTYNLFLSDAIDLMQSGDDTAMRNAASKALHKTMRVLTYTAVVNSAVQSFWDAFRSAGDPDDEDDLDFAQRFIEAMGWDYDAENWKDQLYAALTGNLADNLDMLNNVPIISDYWSDAKEDFLTLALGQKSSSYSSSDSLDSAWVGHLKDWVTSAGNTVKQMQDQEARDNSTKTGYDLVAKTARVISDFTGVPAYSAQRDIVATYNTLIARNFGLPVLLKTKKSNRQKTKADAYKTIMTSTDLDEARAAIDEAAGHSNTYKSINDAMKKNLKDDLVATYNESPSEATKMINRIAEMRAYCGDQYDTPKDKTHRERVEYYKKEVKEWLE